ncbi:MAG: antibiotic biosynthesis monooxygenase family protein [Nitrospiria bacterium]
MITVGMNYEVLEGKDQPFEKKFALVLDAMGKTPGHKKTNLYKDVFQNRSYLIVSEWHSREAFDSFVSSDAFAKVTDWGKEHILASRPKHEVYGDEPAAPVAGGCPVDH